MFILVFFFGQIAKKCLNTAFTYVPEDCVDFSPISEIPDANRNEDVIVSLNLVHRDLFVIKVQMLGKMCHGFENHIYPFFFPLIFKLQEYSNC